MLCRELNAVVKTDANSDSKLIITSVKEIMFLSLSVCLQDNSKSCG